MNHQVTFNRIVSVIIRRPSSVTSTILVILLVLVNAFSSNQGELTEEKCPLTSSLQLSRHPQNVSYIAAEEANVFFTVLLPQVDCQSDALQRRDTLIYLNAITYALHLLNGKVQVQGDGHSSIKQYLPLLHRQPAVSSDGQLLLKYGAKLVTVPRSLTNGAPTSSPTTLVCTMLSHNRLIQSTIDHSMRSDTHLTVLTIALAFPTEVYAQKVHQ